MIDIRRWGPAEGETTEQWEARLKAEFEADYPPLPKPLENMLRELHAGESTDLVLLHEEHARGLEELAVRILHLLAYWDHALSEDTRRDLEGLAAYRPQEGARR